MCYDIVDYLENQRIYVKKYPVLLPLICICVKWPHVCSFCAMCSKIPAQNNTTVSLSIYLGFIFLLPCHGTYCHIAYTLT